LAAEEKEKQLKLIDELESGGSGMVEDIDLTTDDWVNVNPNEIAKRYDMIRRYVRENVKMIIIYINSSNLMNY
jgi:predicted regulator of amino acid metabolism with ACT domain